MLNFDNENNDVGRLVKETVTNYFNNLTEPFEDIDEERGDEEA